VSSSLQEVVSAIGAVRAEAEMVTTVNVPLFVKGRRFGVLNVGWTEDGRRY
jgi:hypothetical protein